jgi:hypothetical protein
MSVSMTCNKPCDDHVRATEEMVFETVTYFRNRGHKRDIAIEQTALALGLSPRKTWSLFYSQPVAVLGEEYNRIRRAFANHLDEQADDLVRRSEAARLRRQQIETNV